MTASKEDYIRYRIKKADETYQDAVLLAQHERWNSSMNRLYYSCFYLVSALLFKNDIKAETHNGVKTQFFLKFIKSNLISKEFGKLYSHLFVWRQETDYGDFSEFKKETIIPLLDEVEQFNNELKKLLY